MEKRINDSNWMIKVITCSIYLISLWALSPVIKGMVNQVYALGLALLMMLLMFAYEGVAIPKRRAWIILVIVLRIIYKGVGISNETWPNHSNAFIFFFMMYTSLFMADHFSSYRLKRISNVLILIATINLGQQFLSYARNGFQSLYSRSELLDSGIVAGGTSYVAVIMLFGMLMTVIFMQAKKNKTKLMTIAILVACIFYIVFIQTRATSLIILILFIAACVFFGTEKPVSLSRVVIFVIAALVFVVSLQLLLNFIVSHSDAYYARKFGAISTLLSGNVVINENSMGDSSLNERIFLATVSLKTWTSNILIFLFGKGYDAGFYQTTGIGRHSEIIDTLPRYGLLGFVVLVNTLKIYHSDIFRKMNLNRGYSMIFITMIIFATMNGMLFPDIGCMFCWLIPATLATVTNNKD